MDSRSLDDLTIDELAALPKWVVPPRLQKRLDDALAAENRDRIKKADDDVAAEAFHDPRGYWPARKKDTRGSQDSLFEQTTNIDLGSKVGARGGRYRIRFNPDGKPYRQYF